MTAEERAAALVVCAHAADVADARQLLEAIGLIDAVTVAAGEAADDLAAMHDWMLEHGYLRAVPA